MDSCNLVCFFFVFCIVIERMGCFDRVCVIAQRFCIVFASPPRWNTLTHGRFDFKWTEMMWNCPVVSHPYHWHNDNQLHIRCSARARWAASRSRFFFEWRRSSEPVERVRNVCSRKLKNKITIFISISIDYVRKCLWSLVISRNERTSNRIATNSTKRTRRSPDECLRFKYKNESQPFRYFLV